MKRTEILAKYKDRDLKDYSSTLSIENQLRYIPKGAKVIMLFLYDNKKKCVVGEPVDVTDDEEVL